MSSVRQFLLGLFFLVTVGILGYFTLGQSDLKLFGRREEISVYFPRADGLRRGDSVLVAGVRWGRVAAVSYDPSAPEHRRVAVTASLDEPLDLREGYAVRIEEATLLGGRRLTIEPGPAGAPSLPPEPTLDGTVALNPIEALGDLVRDNERAVGETIRGVRDLVEGLQQGRGALGRMLADDSLAEDLSRGLRGASRTFENVERITADLVEGRGTLGRLFASDELYLELQRVSDNLNALLEDARSLTADTREGRGLVGRLLTDEALSEDVAGGVRDLREIVGTIQRGEGTLGRLVRDDGLARDLSELARRLTAGEGFLGRLFSDEELYEDVRSFSEDLAAVMAHVRSGRGSAGRILMDEELYDELQTAIGLITRSLEEYREAAPISTMTSVIFGAF